MSRKSEGEGGVTDTLVPEGFFCGEEMRRERKRSLENKECGRIRNNYNNSVNNSNTLLEKHFALNRQNGNFIKSKISYQGTL